MKIFKPHPAALAFPLLRGDELEALKKSILERGQDFPAVIHEGRLLDGRNRQEAVRQLVVEKKLAPSTELKVTPFRGGSIAGFVRAANVDRRHLSVSQLAMIAAKLLPLFRKEAKERQAAAARATNRSKKRGQKALALVGKARKPVTAAQEASKAMGGTVSARSIERAEFVRKHDPALAKAVDNNELTVKQAEQKIRKVDQVAKAEVYVFPEGAFPVIVTDWPWKYRDQLDGSKMERALPYPPQSIDEICASIDKLPVADDCALFCWVTNGILLDPGGWALIAAKLSQRWGFVAKQIRTWVKTTDSGGDVTSQGWVWRNDTEHLVRLERGRPVFRPTGAAHGVPIQRTSFEAPVGEHSVKPQVAYDDIASICAASLRLELHSRKPRAGWVTSGSELAQAVPAPAGGKGEPSFPAFVSGDSPSPTAAPERSLQSERSDEDTEPVAADWADGTEFACANCHATFISREILSKHAKACGEVVSAVDAIAAGAAIIEVTADRAAVIEEVKRLAALKPFVGSPDDVRLTALEKALAAFRLLKRETRATIREREEERAAAVATDPALAPDPESLAAVADSDICF